QGSESSEQVKFWFFRNDDDFTYIFHFSGTNDSSNIECTRRGTLTSPHHYHNYKPQ
ncbi:hypothetical protein KIN20_032066, partial [Parelaphostrongylus tenuis]